MPQYLLAIYHPDHYNPASEDDAMLDAISALNHEMVTADVRRFVCGLGPEATTLHPQPGGDLSVTEGLHLQTGQHMAGFWVLETANREQALAWARKAAHACRVPVEVRDLLQRPAPAKLTSPPI